MRTLHVVTFVISSLLCGCSPRVSYLYRCEVEDQHNELKEKCERIGAAGEKVQISAWYGSETSGSNSGEEGFNCFQIVVRLPQSQTAELDSGKSFLQYDSARVALVKNDKRVGGTQLTKDDSRNTLSVALYGESGDAFPAGEGSSTCFTASVELTERWSFHSKSLGSESIKRRPCRSRWDISISPPPCRPALPSTSAECRGRGIEGPCGASECGFGPMIGRGVGVGVYYGWWRARRCPPENRSVVQVLNWAAYGKVLH